MIIPYLLILRRQFLFDVDSDLLSYPGIELVSFFHHFFRQHFHSHPDLRKGDSSVEPS